MSQTVARAPAAQYRWGVYRGDLPGKPPPLKSAAAVPAPRYAPNRNGRPCSSEDVFTNDAHGSTFRNGRKLGVTTRATRYSR